MEKFKFLYEAVNYFLPIFSHNLRYAFHYEYYSGEYIIHKTKREKVRQAFYYCEDENTGVTQFSNVFQCGNGLYISYKFICDGEFDCPDRSDEYGCVCNEITHYSSKCKFILTKSKRKVCSKFYFNYSANNCHMILFSHVVTTEDDKTIFFSYDRRNISSPLTIP